MNKVAALISSSTVNSSGLKYLNPSPNAKKSVEKKIVNNQNNRSLNYQKNTKKNNSFAVFKYLIITTTIVFAFGGLGFGLALRCGQELQISQSSVHQ